MGIRKGPSFVMSVWRGLTMKKSLVRGREGEGRLSVR